MIDLTPYLPQLAVAWTAYFIATASPGPAIIAIIATSISQGRRAGLALASGVLTGSYIWAILTASGLSALIRTYGEAIIVLKIVGGCYLLWLAWNAYRAARKSEETYRAQMAALPALSPRRQYLKGLGIHLTNPKAIFNWIMLTSLGMPPGAPGGIPSDVSMIQLKIALGLVMWMPRPLRYCRRGDRAGSAAICAR